MIECLLQFADANRSFQYDYIYIDAIILLVWVIFLLRNKKYYALTLAVAIAPIIYLIDAVIWWNTSAGMDFAVGTFIREYWIGGVQVPHPAGHYFWIKFGADFMMTISYAVFTFSWISVMFESIRKIPIDIRQISKYTLMYCMLWIIIPLFSILLPINNTIVEAVRHMNSQIIFMIVNVIVGYTILMLVYRKEPKIVGRVFLIGVVASLVMEVPLLIFGIRPTGIKFVLFEAVFLLNQGVPYLFLVWDKLLRQKGL